jgi:hypothetical protein
MEWWIVHRQRAQHKPGDLDRPRRTTGRDYRVPLIFEQGACAEAMTIRDTKAEAGAVTEALGED